ncbi:hypothetical protein PSP6_80120 [Paraburkholderia tropica]|nr:hypothetical protein PSP6_80120 [Paraburkholderia tropica]
MPHWRRRIIQIVNIQSIYIFAIDYFLLFV